MKLTTKQPLATTRMNSKTSQRSSKRRRSLPITTQAISSIKSQIKCQQPAIRKKMVTLKNLRRYSVTRSTWIISTRRNQLGRLLKISLDNLLGQTDRDSTSKFSNKSCRSQSNLVMTLLVINQREMILIGWKIKKRVQFKTDQVQISRHRVLTWSRRNLTIKTSIYHYTNRCLTLFQPRQTPKYQYMANPNQ